MISITTKTAETIDGVFLEELPSSVFRNAAARVVRTPTLDGGAVIDHRGFSEYDREFTIRAVLDEQTANDLWEIYRAETLVNLSCREGFFSGTISNMVIDGGLLTLTFLVGD